LPSMPSASTHPTLEDIAFSAVDVQRVRSIPLRGIRLRSFSSRLAPASGRIEFLIVRTSFSFPVALHLRFHGRSYVPLPPGQRTARRRTSTSLTWHPHGRTSVGCLSRPSTAPSSGWLRTANSTRRRDSSNLPSFQSSILPSSYSTCTR
jgi:hypothetical protein